MGNQLELPKIDSLPKDIQKETMQNDILRNAHFMKKLPPGAEASNVLVGEVDFLQRHITAFIRLKAAKILGDLTEVSFKKKQKEAFFFRCQFQPDSFLFYLALPAIRLNSKRLGEP